jgi:glycosyl hydrolase family 79
VHRLGGRIRNLAARVVLSSGCAVMLVGLGGALAPSVAAADQATLAANVGATPTGQPMAPGFLGVSLEYKALHVYTGRDPRAVNPVLLTLLRALAPGQAPVVRIGGDSTDSTWWPMRRVIPPGGINYALNKGWLRTTQALARDLGAHLIMGINLAANRPALAAAEARAIVQGIGRRYIQALEIGNEADVYGVFAWYRDRRGRVVFSRSSKYSLSGFNKEFSRWRAALPAAPLAGPAFSSLGWMSGLAGFIAAQPKLSLVTFHRYPLRGCNTDPSSTGFPSIPNLLSDPSSAGLAAGVAPLVAVAHARRLAFRLDELNSAACSGRRGVSDTFASALWALDTLFNMAAVGVDGVNIHSLPGAAYEPFTFSRRGSAWTAFVHPMYYGLLMFTQAFPPGARLLPVDVASGPVKVWATSAPDGRTHVVLINKDASAPVLVQLQLPGAPAPAAAESLLAPSLTAGSGVSLGGQTFGASTSTGALPGPLSVATVNPAAGVYSVSLPAGSAVMLTR